MPQILLSILLLMGYLVLRTVIITNSMERQAAESEKRVCLMMHGEIRDSSGAIVLNANSSCDEIVELEAPQVQ